MMRDEFVVPERMQTPWALVAARGPVRPEPEKQDTQALEMEQARERFESCGIGRRFHAADFRTMKPIDQGQGRAIRECEEYAEGDGPRAGAGALLIGDPGRGKTHILAAILRRCAERGLSVCYLTAEAFFLGLRSSMDARHGETEIEYLHRLGRYQVLALDDLHTLTEGEGYQYRTLWYLLDLRYSDCRATLCASNLKLAQFKERIDHRTRRRLEAEVVSISE